jgi:hypothetical protein
MELLDGKTSTLLQLLSTLQGACHSTPGEGDATGGGNEDDTGDGGEDDTGVGGDDDTGASMHEPMEEGGTIVEEEGVGGDVDTGAAMHEAMEEGGTMVEEEGVGGDVDTGAAMHEPMEEGGTIGRRGSNTSRGPNDQRHLPGCVALLQAHHMTCTGVFMLV